MSRDLLLFVDDDTGSVRALVSVVDAGDEWAPVFRPIEDVPTRGLL